MSNMRVKGLAQVQSNLNVQMRRVKFKTDASVMAGALVLKAGSQRRCPVRTGNLKASAQARLVRKASEGGAVAQVGHSAYYAIYVHENLQAHHNNGMAKFLERAMVEDAQAIISAMKASMK